VVVDVHVAQFALLQFGLRVHSHYCCPLGVTNGTGGLQKRVVASQRDAQVSILHLLESDIHFADRLHAPFLVLLQLMVESVCDFVVLVLTLEDLMAEVPAKEIQGGVTIGIRTLRHSFVLVFEGRIFLDDAVDSSQSVKPHRLLHDKDVFYSP
jgi:hypothetical protein